MLLLHTSLGGTEWYSRGLRGRFAKSLGWVTGAEVRILSTPPFCSMTVAYCATVFVFLTFFQKKLDILTKKHYYKDCS